MNWWIIAAIVSAAINVLMAWLVVIMSKDLDECERRERSLLRHRLQDRDELDEAYARVRAVEGQRDELRVRLERFHEHID